MGRTDKPCGAVLLANSYWSIALWASQSGCEASCRMRRSVAARGAAGLSSRAPPDASGACRALRSIPLPTRLSAQWRLCNPPASLRALSIGRAPHCITLLPSACPLPAHVSFKLSLSPSLPYRSGTSTTPSPSTRRGPSCNPCWLRAASPARQSASRCCQWTDLRTRGSAPPPAPRCCRRRPWWRQTACRTLREPS